MRLKIQMAAFIFVIQAVVAGQAPPNPPIARVVPRADKLHGETRIDNYYWLREKTDPDVLTYLQAENAYTESGMKHTEELQETLYKEMLGRIKETDVAVPYRRDGYWYYSRTEQGKSYPLFCRKKGTLDAAEEIFLDQNALARGQKFHALGGWDVSPDGTKLLYLEDLTGFRQYSLHVKDLTTGRILASIPNVWNGTAWANDNKTFFYMTADEAKRPNAVWRHVMSAIADNAVKVFQEDDVLNNVTVRRSRSGKYILIGATGFTSSEWRIVPADEPAAQPRILIARRANVEYDVDHGNGYFYVHTNDRARNFRVVRAPENAASTGNWTDWIAHRDAVFVEGLDVFKRFAVVRERHNGLRRLRVLDVQTSRSHDVTFPEVAYGVFVSNSEEFDTDLFRFVYSSFVTPQSTYDYNMRTRARELKKRREIPSGLDPARYRVERRTAPARDGAQVPVSLLLPAGARLDGSHPLLLYAYGSYGAIREPVFESEVLSLVDRGMIYAVAHIRGGQELGRDWYDAGKMMKKKNTFYDYIDVAEHLIKAGYTKPDRLAGFGVSAGGLLMGAVMNMRPDLFKAIVAGVPFVDLINTMLDASIPLTTQEWEQWGNPQNADAYAYMRSYSPYDNVEAKQYPWLLVQTSFNDSQVMYWEPAKWVAKLRAMKTDRNPLYLKTVLAGGHGGSSGRYDNLREVAFRYAFMLDAVGLAR